MKRALSTGVAAIAVWAAFPATASGAPGEWKWPVHGAVITRYANDEARPYAAGMHRGIDIAAPVGTNVVAARGGTVTYAGALGSAGLTVAVRTSDGRYATSYLHLSRINVDRGESVAAGERLGAVGTTGRRSARQPHLHFGVRVAGSDHDYLDPLTLLPPLAGSANEASAPRPVPAGPPSLVRERIHAPAPVPVAVPLRLPRTEEGGRDWGGLLVIAGAVLLFMAALGRPLLDLLGRLRAAAARLRSKRLRDRSHEAPQPVSGGSDVPAVEPVPQLN